MKKIRIVLAIALMVAIITGGILVQAENEITLPGLTLDKPVVKILTNQNRENDPLWETKLEMFKEEYGGEIQDIKVPYADISTKLASMVISGDSPDLVLIRNHIVTNLNAKGMLEPVDTYINLNDPLWRDVKQEMNRFLYNGRPTALAVNISSPFVVLYNSRLFEENGLEDPRDLFERGEWNWDTYTEAAIALTQDRDGDGNIDQWGTWLHPVPLSYYTASTGKTFIKMEGEDLVSNLLDPDLARVMKFIYDLGPAKYNATFLNTGERDNQFKAGNLGMYSVQYNRAWVVFGDMYESGELSYVPIPKDPEANEYYYAADIVGYSIPLGADNSKGGLAWASLMRFFNLDEEIQEENRQTLIDSGVKESDIDFNEEWMDMITPIFTLARTLRDGGYNEQVLPNEIIRGRTTWSALREQEDPKVQSAIDKILGQ